MQSWVAAAECALAAATLLFACSDDAAKKSDAGPAVTTADSGADSGPDFDTGEELRVPVGDGQRAYVTLAAPAAVATAAAAWDLAFEGYDVFTHSGPSGAGAGSAFGPLDAIAFLDAAGPTDTPLFADATGGAFTRWWLYSGPPDHVLYSRFHTYGVKDGAKLYRVQVLGYYGDGAGGGNATPALYTIRYAAVGEAAKTIALDGTATGDAANECVDLGTGTKTKHTLEEAQAASDWHLCFRRDNISVNGEKGGPRGVTAIDFDAAKSADETLDAVSALTPESEASRFDAVNAASFDGQTLRGDRVVSAFTGLWLDKTASPPAPAKAAWLVVGADGKKRYLVGFSRFEGATPSTPGTVVMRVKAVQ